jgi:hypothetical protein
MTKTETIRDLNDTMRKTWVGTINLTLGIQALPVEEWRTLTTKIREFDNFPERDDPYAEHDFGAIELEGGGTAFWKIDYYGLDMETGSPDPSDPTVTTRVLTIMLASEY